MGCLTLVNSLSESLAIIQFEQQTLKPQGGLFSTALVTYSFQVSLKCVLPADCLKATPGSQKVFKNRIQMTAVVPTTLSIPRSSSLNGSR